jgi:hypothetical protein
MTGRERSLRAIEGRDVDYPPAWAPCICSTDSIEEILGRSEVWSDPAQTYLAAFRALKVDMINQFIVYAPGQFEARSAVVDRRLPTLAPEEVAQRLRSRLPEMARHLEEMGEEEIGEDFARRAFAGQALAGDDMLWIEYDGAFQIPTMLYGEFGYENYFVFLCTYPDLQEEVWALQAEIGRRHNRAVAAAMERHRLPKLVRLDHDMTDSRGSIVRMEMMERHYFPHFRRAIAPFVDAGVRLVWHSDGNINDFIPHLLDAGVNGFQGFQEECGVNYEAVCNLRDRNGDPLMIWGSVSVTRVLPFCTPEEICADVRRCWQAAPRHGYFVGATSSICPEVPTENIVAMFDEHTKCLY